MTRWRRARQRWLRRGGQECTLASVLVGLGDWLSFAGGPLGLPLRRGHLVRPRVVEFGKSSPVVFPVPLLRRGDAELAKFGRKHRDAVLVWANMCIVALNDLYDGDGDYTMVPTQAQRRVQGRMLMGVSRFLAAELAWPEAAVIQEVLRHSDGYEPSRCVAEPLGERGGVPDRAATVDLAGLLDEHFPGLAHQVRCPRSLLLSVDQRPARLKRPHTLVGPTYPSLVARNVAAGLQGYGSKKRVRKHRGVALVAGAFGVKKSDTEQRVISDLPVNQLLDPDALPRPTFAYPPRLRVVKTLPGTRVKLWKRDLRHYFHQLAIGKAWRKYMAHPPVPDPRGGGAKVFPFHHATPMGFAPSAGWAQAASDTAFLKAGLPQERRVTFDRPCPTELPLWGSIVDDLWALDERSAGDRARSQAAFWMTKAERAWDRLGVPVHHGKSVDGGSGEFQGTEVHPTEHWLGTTRRRRLDLFAATLALLGQQLVYRKDVERLVGKHGFCQSYRPCLRSTFSQVYVWLERLPLQGRKPVAWCPSAWHEVLMSAILLPFAEQDLDAGWCPRVECTDAAPGGHGRAWATLPLDSVQHIARWADHRAPYTTLGDGFGVDVDVEGRCSLARVTLPPVGHWFKVGRPGGYEHITLEEAHAKLWGMEARLHRPSELGQRVLHAGDNAPCEGAFIKGRSASRRLNRRCRRGAAIELAGGFSHFHFWISTGKNPADEPSGWHGSRQARGGGRKPPQPLPRREVIPLAPAGWASREKLFLHFCSGPRREGDLCEMVELEAREAGLVVKALAYDPVVDPAHDLTSPALVRELRGLCSSGDVMGSFAGPPCSTVSRARHRALGGRRGPRPLRSRDEPLLPLPELSETERRACALGTHLFLLCLELFTRVHLRGGWAGQEHPQDPGRHPFPSFWIAQEVVEWISEFGLHVVSFDQCRHGSMSQKPTSVVTNDAKAVAVLGLRCNHRHRHKGMYGLAPGGGFVTAQLARYPPQLCQALARLAVGALVTHQQDRSHGRRPWQAPWAHHYLLDECAQAGDDRQVRRRIVRFQL